MMSDATLKANFLKRVDAWPTDKSFCRGVWLTIQALNRDEAMSIGSIEDIGEREALMISKAVIEPFTLTVEEVLALRKASEPVELEQLTEDIATLSGMNKKGREAQNEAFKSLREQSRAGVRALPSAEAEQDDPGTPEHAHSV